MVEAEAAVGGAEAAAVGGAVEDVVEDEAAGEGASLLPGGEVECEGVEAGSHRRVEGVGAGAGEDSSRVGRGNVFRCLRVS